MGSFRKFKTTFSNLLRDVPPRIARQVLRRLSREDPSAAGRKIRRMTERQSTSVASSSTNTAKKKKFLSAPEPMKRCRCLRKSATMNHESGHSRNRKMTFVPGNFCRSKVLVSNQECESICSSSSNNSFSNDVDDQPTHKSSDQQQNRFTSEVFVMSTLDGHGVSSRSGKTFGQPSSGHETKADERSVVVDSDIPYFINTSDDSQAHTIFIYNMKVYIHAQVVCMFK